ncbi:MAG: UDP-N-acetylglucosamine 2-epimerase (non-hydrolyzing) [Candidatus Cloacimonadota bacterium]|nr:MAG: UDP-N-acetylglucosamine 2-epimerase (non-hydrolyzing) [Candidatus Cloacimonadota bacterium]PIE79297.1 MAG: UDP-N-acetylglucosamine 2-epimerase (non-hydrolyzing) [Candidatus Delongbacteria bacterium]
MLKVINVVGTRPNFVKVAPIHKLMVESNSITPYLVHTGQHYDEKMSKVFFEDLGLPEPYRYLHVGSGSHAVQTAKVMIEFEKVCLELNPDLVLVVGDVNSTLAATLVAKKLGIKVAHVESGLRSFDNRMPEELNRLATDAIADLLFVSEQSGLDNLKKEGVSSEKIIYVGNVMIDSLINNLDKARSLPTLDKYGVKSEKFILATLHRPSNVDDENNLKVLVDIFKESSKIYDIIFPVHPRTIKNFERYNLLEEIIGNSRIHLIDPAPYLEFIGLMSKAALLLTDSGGIQEETTYLGVPCLTLRENTERPSTITEGTNMLIPTLSKDVVMDNIIKISNDDWEKGSIPKFWDGKASNRIVEYLEKI